MPLEGYPGSPFPTLEGHARLARVVDDASVSALWMRDVPFYDPNFGDTGQILDPMVYLDGLLGSIGKLCLQTFINRESKSGIAHGITSRYYMYSASSHSDFDTSIRLLPLPDRRFQPH